MGQGLGIRVEGKFRISPGNFPISTELKPDIDPPNFNNQLVSRKEWQLPLLWNLIRVYISGLCLGLVGQHSNLIHSEFIVIE